jgi:hypothetical protein
LNWSFTMNPFRRNKPKRPARFDARQRVAIIAVIPIIAAAAISSFQHIRELALEVGESPLLALILPVSVDCLILLGSLLMGMAHGWRPKAFGTTIFIIGVLVSLAANMRVAEPDPWARAVSAWPAVSLLLSVEALLLIVFHTGRTDLGRSAIEAVTALADEAGPQAVADILRALEADMPDLAERFTKLAEPTGTPTVAEEPSPKLADATPAEASVNSVPVSAEPEKQARPKRKRVVRIGGHEFPKDRNIKAEVISQVAELYKQRTGLADMRPGEQDKVIQEATSISARQARRARRILADSHQQLAEQSTERPEADQAPESDAPAADNFGQEPLADLADKVSA